MKTVLMFTLPLIALILIAAPLVPVFRKSLSGKQAKHRLAANLCAFFGFCILAVLLPAGGAVSAAADAGSVAASSAGMAYLGAALSAGLAASAPVSPLLPALPPQSALSARIPRASVKR